MTHLEYEDLCHEFSRRLRDEGWSEKAAADFCDACAQFQQPRKGDPGHGIGRLAR